MAMTPREYASKYRNLEVYLYTDAQARLSKSHALPPGGTWQSVDVHSYRLGLKQAYRSSQHSIEVFKSKVRPHINQKSESITVWVKTVDGLVTSKTYHDRKELAENVNDPFYGKGSPEEVQVVLQLAVRYGVFAPEKVQIYCDNGNIGLDCNGFIGNYIRHARQGLPWDTDARGKQQKTEYDANTLIRSMLNFGAMTAPIKTIEEISQRPQSVYLLALANERGKILDHWKQPDGSLGYGHIMISEPGPLRKVTNFKVPGMKNPAPEAVVIKVIESTGGIGLVESDYHLISANQHGVFQVYRGSKNALMNVVIAVLR